MLVLDLFALDCVFSGVISGANGVIKKALKKLFVCVLVRAKTDL